MNNGHITSTPRMKKNAMNVNPNTTTVNTDTKETIMNSDTNTDMEKNTSIALMFETVVSGCGLEELTSAPTLKGSEPTTPLAGLFT